MHNMSSGAKSLTSPFRFFTKTRPSVLVLLIASVSTSTSNNAAQSRRASTSARQDLPARKSSRRGPLRTIELMPFQAYQLALQIIKEDRQEKLRLIKMERERIAFALSKPGVTKESRHVQSMLKYLERLEILKDINNPRVRYNVDNGIIGMNRPIYRYLLNKKWREMRRPILMQRLEQMHVIPDVLPYINPVVDVQVRFKGREVKPGVILNTLKTEKQPTVKIIPFELGNMLCTIAIVDPDVPDPAKDGYRYRLHWLVSNIPISATQTQALGRGAKQSSTIVPWLPPYCQKGIPYHRYAMMVFKQSRAIDAEALKGKTNRDDFNMRSFQAKQELEAIGAFMWRNSWDDNTAGVMKRHNLPGWDKMWQRVKV